VKITLRGHIPAKKNLYRRSKNGGMFRDNDVVAQINALQSQAILQWQGREPLSRPKASFLFHIADLRADVDNKHTTVLDILVAAKILVNDNAKHGPAPVTYDWIIDKDASEGVEIEFK